MIKLYSTIYHILKFFRNDICSIFTKNLLFFGFGLWLFLAFPIKVAAQTVVFSDDFSQGFEKWQDVRNTFNLWSVINSFQIQAYVDKNFTLAQIVPKDEYWNPEWKNILFSYDYKYLSGADRNATFWFRDTLNWTGIHFVSNSWFLSHVANGFVIWQKSGYVSLTKDKTYHVQLHLEDGSVKLLLDGSEIFDVHVPTYDGEGGKVTLIAGTGAVSPTQAIFSNVAVALLGVVDELPDWIEKLLPISLTKQNDPQWTQIEYDTATAWSSGGYGIGDWGCLIASINMILNYYGISQMPDGQEINPETLNAWLNSQPDGYVGGGLVNWSAITRLVRIINEVYSTTKLEYSRIGGDSLGVAVNEINQDRPVILQIPGHFLVGNGIVANDNDSELDLIISDPLYEYELFSQHQKDLLSTRILQPTMTDLSYFHMNHQVGLEVNILDGDMNSVSSVQKFSDFLFDSSKQHSSPEFTFYEFSKPPEGTYFIEVQQDKLGEFELTIFVYDQQGNLSNLSYKGVAGPTLETTTLLKIDYYKDQPSTLYSGVNFENFSEDINFLKSIGKIKKHYVALELKNWAIAAQDSSAVNKPRYIGAIKVDLDWYQDYLGNGSKNILQKRLEEIERNL
jgi:hypothetical protein